MDVNWLPLDLHRILTCSGVYGWTHKGSWLYIGQTKNLAQRLGGNHPALAIALSLDRDISYWYFPCERPGRLERQLHKELKPEWCGGLDIYAACPACLWAEQPVPWEELEAAIRLL